MSVVTRNLAHETKNHT